MDKPQLGPSDVDRWSIGERAIEKAFADAAFAMFGHSRAAPGAPAEGDRQPALHKVRLALLGARWRR